MSDPTLYEASYVKSLEAELTATQAVIAAAEKVCDTPTGLPDETVVTWANTSQAIGYLELISALKAYHATQDPPRVGT